MEDLDLLAKPNVLPSASKQVLARNPLSLTTDQRNVIDGFAVHRPRWPRTRGTSTDNFSSRRIFFSITTKPQQAPRCVVASRIVSLGDNASTDLPISPTTPRSLTRLGSFLVVRSFPSNQRGCETKKIFIDPEYEYSTPGGTSTSRPGTKSYF